MKLVATNRWRSYAFIVFTVAGASSISMLGGLALESAFEKLLPIVPLIIALPALNTMVGDYATVIASFQEFGMDKQTTKELVRAIIKSIIINIFSVILLSAVIAIMRGYSLDASFVLRYIAFVGFAISFTVLAIWIITVAMKRILVKRHHNVEDVLIPVITSVTDVLMLVLISLSAVTIFW